MAQTKVYNLKALETQVVDLTTVVSPSGGINSTDAHAQSSLFDYRKQKQNTNSSPFPGKTWALRNKKHPSGRE